MISTMPFVSTNPSRQDYWRSVILFGRNVASYKFALAKSLLELASHEQNFIPLEELSVPFSRHVAEHLKRADKQATSSSSRFLRAVRQFNNGKLDQDALVRQTVLLGFENVIDAFHVVGPAPIPIQFFVDERKKRGGIVITDELLRLKDSLQFQSLPHETEARWRLVETAWQLGLNPALLSVSYDNDLSLFFVKNQLRQRINVTSSRDALNGYQKGRCFYCFREISVLATSPIVADVDHFFPHTILARTELNDNLNGVWNLVLACRECNRGEKGKSARVPHIRYLERLFKRNNFLIDSHHPLRETLIAQTGTTEISRRRFLQQQHTHAKRLLIHEWFPPDELESAF
jgi:hypothetical protein